MPLSPSIPMSRRRSEAGVILHTGCEERVVSLAGQRDSIRLLQMEHRCMNFLLPQSASQLTSSSKPPPFSFSPCQSSLSLCLLLMEQQTGEETRPPWHTGVTESLWSPTQQVQTPHRRNISVEKLSLLPTAASAAGLKGSAAHPMSHHLIATFP